MAGASRHRALKAQDLAHLGGESGVNGGEVGVGQVPQFDSPLLADSHAGPGNLVRNPEGHPILDQPLGDVGNTEADLRRFFYLPDVPDPDLIVRTSGELRLSNFWLWEAAYSESYFTDIHWPDFDEAALDAALGNYAGQERRYGGLKS